MPTREEQDPNQWKKSHKQIPHKPAWGLSWNVQKICDELAEEVAQELDMSDVAVAKLQVEFYEKADFYGVDRLRKFTLGEAMDDVWKSTGAWFPLERGPNHGEQTVRMYGIRKA
jgi:hypothetical protein